MYRVVCMCAAILPVNSLPVPVFHFWPKLTHPAARSLCDSWATCLFYIQSALWPFTSANSVIFTDYNSILPNMIIVSYFQLSLLMWSFLSRPVYRVVCICAALPTYAEVKIRLIATSVRAPPAVVRTYFYYYRHNRPNNNIVPVKDSKCRARVCVCGVYIGWFDKSASVYIFKYANYFRKSDTMLVYCVPKKWRQNRNHNNYDKSYQNYISS